MPCASANVLWLGLRQHVWQLSFMSLRVSSGKHLTLSVLNALSLTWAVPRVLHEMIAALRSLIALTQLKVIQRLPPPLFCSPCQTCRLSPRTCCPLHLSALQTTCSCPKSRAAAPAARTPPVTRTTLCWCHISLGSSPVSHITSPNTSHAYTAKLI